MNDPIIIDDLPASALHSITSQIQQVNTCAEMVRQAELNHQKANKNANDLLSTVLAIKGIDTEKTQYKFEVKDNTLVCTPLGEVKA